VDAVDPGKAVLQSRVSMILGIVLASMGLASIFVFWITFRLSLFSLAGAAIVLGGIGLKAGKAWRKPPLSMKEWREYKSQMFSPRVFTDQSRDQIPWADSGRLAASIASQSRSNRFAIPLLLVVGVGLGVLSYHFCAKTGAFLANARRTKGSVVELRESDSSDASSTYAPVVEFKDEQGGAHTFVDSLSSSPPSYRVGEAVGVL
jgi:uncharacterized protein DUF3592